MIVARVVVGEVGRDEIMVSAAENVLRMSEPVREMHDPAGVAVDALPVLDEETGVRIGIEEAQSRPGRELCQEIKMRWWSFVHSSFSKRHPDRIGNRLAHASTNPASKF